MLENALSSKDLNQEVSSEPKLTQKHTEVDTKKITDDSDCDLHGRVMQWFQDRNIQRGNPEKLNDDMCFHKKTTIVSKHL